MGSFDIQFTQEDIVARVLPLFELGTDECLSEAARITHHLGGPTHYVLISASEFTSESEKKGQRPTIHQRALVDIIATTTGFVDFMVKRLLDLPLDKDLLKTTESRAKRYAREISEEVQRLDAYKHVAENVRALGEIAPRREKDLMRVDNGVRLFFYTYNHFFSPAFERDVYSLHDDIRQYALVVQTGNAEDIRLRTTRLPLTEFALDYFTNAVVPLLSNAYDHALNPDNDLQGRLESDARRFRVDVDYESPKTPTGELVITVKDNGFGIQPDVYERLFEQGVTSKTDDTTPHGIGLWGAKRFVEEQGGRMWCETELGEGTTFSFTIPYTSFEHGVYRQ